MITTKIKVRDHIAEFAIGKFGANFSNPVKIPSTYPLYHLIWELLAIRPLDRQIDSGNLELIIPNRRSEEDDIRKNPERFNFLSNRSAKIIDYKLETMMFAELHDVLDENKHRKGIDYQVSVHMFICRYSIISITDDALLKNYYRWRRKIKRLSTKRNYTTKK